MLIINDGMSEKSGLLLHHFSLGKDDAKRMDKSELIHNLFGPTNFLCSKRTDDRLLQAIRHFTFML